VRLFPTLSDEFVDQAHVGRYDGKTCSKPCEDRVSTLEDETVIVGPRDEHVTGCDAEATPQCGRHDEPSLRTNDHIDCLFLCHSSYMVPHLMISGN